MAATSAAAEAVGLTRRSVEQPDGTLQEQEDLEEAQCCASSQVCSSDNSNNNGRCAAARREAAAAIDERFQKEVPLLLRVIVQFSVVHFGPALGLSASATLWRFVHTSHHWFSVPDIVWTVLWFITAILLAATSALYIARCIFFPLGVRHDFRDNTLVNFFAAPIITLTNLLSGVPPSIMPKNCTALEVFLYILFVCQLLLSLYIYGEWLFGSHNHMGRVSPLYQMAVIGYLVLTSYAVAMDHVDLAFFCQSVGVLFWLLIFFSLFQRLAARARRAKPGPLMFLFLAPPAAAAISCFAFATMSGLSEITMSLAKGCGSMFVYIDTFIYLLLLRLLPTFWTNQFSVSIWAYVFPLSSAASAATLFSYYSMDTFWMVVASVEIVVATIATCVIVVLTIVFTFTRHLPDDPIARLLYVKHNLISTSGNTPSVNFSTEDTSMTNEGLVVTTVGVDDSISP
mmetsp:Transcript_14739/g.31581  ORF Transcript_14739/g.31581 Transcript_14739/m.31581 type:complete len:456 (+) Transcript_14739:1-1368(+)